MSKKDHDFIEMLSAILLVIMMVTGMFIAKESRDHVQQQIEESMNF